MNKFTIKPRVFNRLYLDYLKDDTRMQIYFGGSSSGKSRFLAQRCVFDLVNGGRNYLIVRKVAGTIRRSCFNEIAKVISSWGMTKMFNINKSDMIITCQNGYQALFCGLDDVEKLKSITPEKGIVTDVWIEEATEADRNDIKQLNKRLRGLSRYKKRMTLSFNPIFKSHWIYEEYFEGKWEEEQKILRDDKILILHSTYKDNKFLAPEDIADLENEDDKYYHDVYSLGKWGVLGGVIFTPWDGKSEVKTGTWRMEYFDDSGFDSFHFGQDFGFAKDEAASGKQHYDKRNKRLYICNEIYETGMTNDVLAMRLKPFVGGGYVTCDSADPKSIQELCINGIRAIGAIKGKDSVVFGIQWLRQLEIIIHPRCKNAREEFETYKWKEDKNGNVLPVPVDKKNHFIDQLRYAMESEMGLIHKEKTVKEDGHEDYLEKRYGVKIPRSAGKSRKRMGAM